MAPHTAPATPLLPPLSQQPRPRPRQPAADGVADVTCPSIDHCVVCTGGFLEPRVSLTAHETRLFELQITVLNSPHLHAEGTMWR